jgi:16S rRNA (adenine1518-N6/adenine1519-N6)-dimethyltransferase
MRKQVEESTANAIQWTISRQEVLLRQAGLHPDKSLGQNFLNDPQILKQIVQAAEVDAHDMVLEIGPGLGSLTSRLAASARLVVAVELDERLIPILRQALATYRNVRIIHGDILALPFDQILAEEGYLVVANIPYYITSAVIRRLLEAPLRPRRIVLTIQKEVAQRVCAEPGELSLLALSVQVYGTPQIMFHIPAGAFYPPPKVDSAVVRIEIAPAPRLPANELKSFFQLAKAAFSQKRKNLRNSLAAGLGWEPNQAQRLLEHAGIDPHRRPETVSLEEWAALTHKYVQLTKKDEQQPGQETQPSG